MFINSKIRKNGLTFKSSLINTNQLFAILKFRLTQILRIILSGGLSLLILSPFLILTMGFGIKSLTEKGIMYVNIVAIIAIFLTDALRKDKEFLFLLKTDGLILRFIEYALIVLLFNAYALTLWKQTMLYVLAAWAIIALLVIVSRYRTRERIGFNPSKWLTKIMPVRVYELKYGFRQIALLIIPLWLGSFVMSFYAPILPIAILLVCVFLIEHISYKEPIEITQSYIEISHAIKDKILLLAQVIFIIFIPHLVITFLLWYSAIVLAAVLAAFWIALSTMAYALLLRYSYATQAYSSITIGIKLLVFLVVSPLIPLSIYLLYKQYKTAKWQLTSLLR